MDFVNRLIRTELIWFPKYGFGYLDPSTCTTLIKEPLYNDEYFKMYIERDASPIGEKLTQCRIELVRHFVHEPTQLLDIGVGGGAFLRAARAKGWTAHGYDINPTAVKMLKTTGSYRDIDYLGQDWVVTFWDSLEHITNPGMYLFCVKDYCFVSMPIYRDVAHVMISKHYKPGEHVWYFTHEGLVKFMEKYGFLWVVKYDTEIKLGREDAWQYVFRRKD